MTPAPPIDDVENLIRNHNMENNEIKNYLYEAEANVKKLLSAIDRYVYEHHAPGEYSGVGYLQILAKPVKDLIIDAHNKFLKSVIARDEYELAQHASTEALKKFCEIMDRNFEKPSASDGNEAGDPA